MAHPLFLSANSLKQSGRHCNSRVSRIVLVGLCRHSIIGGQWGRQPAVAESFVILTNQMSLDSQA